MGSCFSLVDDDVRPPARAVAEQQPQQQPQQQQKVVYVPPPGGNPQPHAVYRVPEGYGYAVGTGKYSAPTEDPTPVAAGNNWVPQAQYTYAYPMTQTMQYPGSYGGPAPSAPPYGGAYGGAPGPYTTVYVQQPQQQQRQGMGVGTAMLGGFVLGAIAEDMLDSDF